MKFIVDDTNFYSQDKLAMNITLEQGKTLKGAESDVLHGIGQSLHVHYRSPCSVMMGVTNKWVTCLFFFTLEVVEHACGMGTLQMGEFVPNASCGIDTYCIREPLGVCAGICPFNFPSMIPLWVCLQYLSVLFVGLFFYFLCFLNLV